MAYVSLYRKYRPQTFSDVVGQRHVIASLRNAIAQDAVGHAYLFAGPRGTGKTTIARILAMAVNASGGPTPDPDPDDPVSTAIRRGQAMDVIELDMASHGGVDDARELRDRAMFAPVELPRKVYILDEVHMASQAAFNALLKLIEEPPPHVMFLMATTDPQKVLPTILSRVQRLDLRRVGPTDLGEHLRNIAGKEGFTIDDGALAQVLRAGEGSVRDTLSVLEQVVAYAGAGAGAGGEITEEGAAAVLGRTPTARTLEVVEHLAAGDVAGTFSLVQGLLDDGHHLRRFTLDLVQHLRDLLVVQAAPDRPDLIDASDDHREALAAQSSLLSRERLVFAVDVLGDILVQQRTGPPRLPLELALARLAVPAASGDLDALAARVAALEAGAPARPSASTAPARPASPATPAPAPSAPPADDALLPDDQIRSSGSNTTDAPAAATAAPAPAAPAPVEAAPEPDPAPSDTPQPAAAEASLDGIVARWEGVLARIFEVSKKAHAMYLPATPSRLHKGVLTLAYPVSKAFHREQATATSNANLLRDAIEQELGMRVAIAAAEDGNVERRPSPPDVTPSDATVAVDPISGGDPSRGRDEERAAPQPEEPAQAQEPDAPFPTADEPGHVAPPAAPVVAAEPDLPVEEPRDEQALVREAEAAPGDVPDLATARAGIVDLLDATEVDEADLV